MERNIECKPSSANHFGFVVYSNANYVCSLNVGCNQFRKNSLWIFEPTLDSGVDKMSPWDGSRRTVVSSRQVSYWPAWDGEEKEERERDRTNENADIRMKLKTWGNNKVDNSSSGKIIHCDNASIRGGTMNERNPFSKWDCERKWSHAAENKLFLRKTLSQFRLAHIWREE